MPLCPSASSVRPLFPSSTQRAAASRYLLAPRSVWCAAACGGAQAVCGSMAAWPSGHSLLDSCAALQHFREVWCGWEARATLPPCCRSGKMCCAWIHPASELPQSAVPSIRSAGCGVTTGQQSAIREWPFFSLAPSVRVRALCLNARPAVCRAPGPKSVQVCR